MNGISGAVYEALAMEKPASVLDRIANALELANDIRIITLSFEHKAELQRQMAAKLHAQDLQAAAAIPKNGDAPG